MIRNQRIDFLFLVIFFHQVTEKENESKRERADKKKEQTLNTA